MVRRPALSLFALTLLVLAITQSASGAHAKKRPSCRTGHGLVAADTQAELYVRPERAVAIRERHQPEEEIRYRTLTGCAYASGHVYELGMTVQCGRTGCGGVDKGTLGGSIA